MLPATQIDMFYNGLTLRHRDTINVAAGGRERSFMKRRPEECYDPIENITAHHNDWDTLAHRGESSSSTNSSFEIKALAQQMIKMRKDMLQMRDLKVDCLATQYLTLKRRLKKLPHIVVLFAKPSVALPPLSSSSKEVERDPKMITDHVLPESTTRVPPLNPDQHQIPYPSRLNKEKLQDKSDIQVHKFFQMFKKLHFNISLAEALTLMPVLLKKLPEKLGDLEKFLIPSGIAKDVFVQVGRPFLRTARALFDVYREELILRDGDEKLIFHADSTLKHPQKHGNESINMINFIDITCEDCFEEVLKIKKSNHLISGSTTSLSDSFPSSPLVKTSDSVGNP
nr:reverse transcriptase domain-containing protein [Tanacetum cinerariifolium]